MGHSVEDPLPPLREVIRLYGLTARKSFGQNFLLDLNVTRKIARSAGPLAGVTVIEVGPGPGGLTRALLVEGARKVIAIEKDRRCLDALEDIGKAFPGRVEAVEGDALEVDYEKLAHQNGPVRIVANLPYNIATPLLVGWIVQAKWPPFYDSLTLMFQREVAERIVARCGDEAYSRLSILCGWRMRGRILFDLPPRAFTPPPKVHSSVVQLLPRDDAADVSPHAIELVTKAAFGQRRKMLRQSLKALGGGNLLERAGIDATRRAETLEIADFIKLARLVSASSQDGL